MHHHQTGSKKKYDIRRVVVLGAGVMGSQIAAHCINAGLEVHLLDLKSDDADRPNRRAEEAIQNLSGMKPAPLVLSQWAARIVPGNFDDHLHRVADADWICEVVVEDLDIKRELISKIEQHRRPGTIMSSNTSGLPIEKIGEEASGEFREHLLGTHFFNPPRYMKLLELIPAGHTNPEVLNYMARFCEKILGKGVVRCKDTPNFIANRIGIFSMAAIMPWFFNGTFSAREIDYLTGPFTGYSKAATLRTADMAGLDVIRHVAENLIPSVPDDERREVFDLPEKFREMVEKGAIGNKKGHGFYKKEKTKNGNEYLLLDPDTFEYQSGRDVFFKTAEEANEKYDTAADRLKYMVYQTDDAGKFLWEIHCDLLLYSANRIPEIADSTESVDRAMRWGFNWELGPFQRWDAIGVAESVERMEKEGKKVPDAVKQMLKKGRDSFYKDGMVYNLATGKEEEIRPPAENAITVQMLGRAEKEVWGTKDAGLYDMGDGVALLEFRTKQQTLGFDLVKSWDEASEIVKADFDALVIGHDHEHFSYGANLSEALQAVRKKDFRKLEEAVFNFQRMATGLRYQPFPVVAAVSGRTLGGGTELMLHCDGVAAHFELYAGLVELGVGLIPAGGGTKELISRAMGRAAGSEDADSLPFLKKAFKTIGLAKISDSAWKARELGFLKDSDMIVMNRDLLLVTAKEKARCLADAGYAPPEEPKITLLGQTAFAVLNTMLYIMAEAGYASEYDRFLTRKLSRVMTGGNISEPQKVPESFVLQLEREAIMECFREKKTEQRIAQMLQTGKPLRN